MLEMLPFEHTFYMNKYQKLHICNELNVSKRMLRGLLKMDETSCIICLEKLQIKENIRVDLNVQQSIIQIVFIMIIILIVMNYIYIVM